jgi:hypothetical protein
MSFALSPCSPLAIPETGSISSPSITCRAVPVLCPHRQDRQPNDRRRRRQRCAGWRQGRSLRQCGPRQDQRAAELVFSLDREQSTPPLIGQFTSPPAQGCNAQRGGQACDAWPGADGHDPGRVRRACQRRDSHQRGPHQSGRDQNELRFTAAFVTGT